MTGSVDLLATIISSGVSAGLVTFVLNARQQERSTRREKLEELTSILSRQMSMLLNQRTYLQALIDGHLTANELDAKLEQEAQRDVPHDRVQALITIYFPKLLHHVALIAKLQSEWANSLDGRTQLAQINALVAARNDLIAGVLAQAPSVNTPLWKFWR